MRNTMKVLTVMMLAVFLLNNLAYANSFTDWFTTRKPGGSAAYFFQKTLYKDRLYNPVYTKVILPVGQKLFVSESMKADRAIKAGDFDQAIKSLTTKINDTPLDNILLPHFISDEGPNLAKLYDARGYAYYKKGDLNQAASDWNMAVKANPNDSYARDALRGIGK